MSKNVVEISFLNAVSLVSVAVFIDASQAVTKIFHLIPVVGNFSVILFGVMMSIIAVILFSMWMLVIGVPMLDRAPVMMATTVMEVIPIINALPGWTTFILATLFVVNRKAKYNKVNNEVS